jgi:hypothetical protein
LFTVRSPAARTMPGIVGTDRYYWTNIEQMYHFLARQMSSISIQKDYD